MDPLFEKFNILKKKIKLDADKKALIKGRLLQYMDAFDFSPTSGNRIARFFRFAPVYAGVLAAVIAGGGASFAAQLALPGDALYPVKVGFNEKISAAFHFSPEAKANYEVDLAARRLEEVTQLASQRKISGEEKNDIESRFQSHAEKIKSKIQEFEHKGNIRAADTIASRFEASLKAHEKKLGEINVGDENESEVAEIKVGVRSEIGNIMSVRAGLRSKSVSSSFIESGDREVGASTSVKGKADEKNKQDDDRRDGAIKSGDREGTTATSTY